MAAPKTEPPAQQPKSPPKPRRSGLVLALVALGLVAGGVRAFQMGLIPGLKRPSRPAAPAAATLLPPPAPAVPVNAAPATPSPEAQAEDLKHQAIAIVQAWPTSDPLVTVSQRLEASGPPAGAPSWMAEKLTDDSIQVNFYGSKSADGKTEVYEFQVAMGEKSVTPLNAAAKVLLLGETPAGKKGKKVRVKPKDSAVPALGAATPVTTGGPMTGQDGGAPADNSATSAATETPAPAKPVKRKAPKRATASDSAQPSGQQAGPDTQGSAAATDGAAAADQTQDQTPQKSVKKTGKAKGADDAQLLDQLLE
jgi:hypothetical protein